MIATRPTAKQKPPTAAAIRRAAAGILTAQAAIRTATAETARVVAATAIVRQRVSALEKVAVEALAMIERECPAPTAAEVAAAAVRDAELQAVMGRHERQMGMLGCLASLAKSCGSRDDFCPITNENGQRIHPVTLALI